MIDQVGYRNDEGGLVLTNTERQALALLMVARQTAPESPGAVEWEDVPELAESEFGRLEEAIVGVREHLVELALKTGEDPQLIWECVR